MTIWGLCLAGQLSTVVLLASVKTVELETEELISFFAMGKRCLCALRTPAVKQPTIFLFPVQLPLIATQPTIEVYPTTALTEGVKVLTYVLGSPH